MVVKQQQTRSLLSATSFLVMQSCFPSRHSLPATSVWGAQSPWNTGWFSWNDLCQCLLTQPFLVWTDFLYCQSNWLLQFWFHPCWKHMEKCCLSNLDYYFCTQHLLHHHRWQWWSRVQNRHLKAAGQKCHKTSRCKHKAWTQNQMVWCLLAFTRKKESEIICK